MNRLFWRLAFIIILFLGMVGSVFFISDTMKYNPMIEVILEDYDGFGFYNEDIDNLPYEKEELLALQNLEHHRFNKKDSMENPWINQKFTDPFNQQEVESMKESVSKISGELYNRYLFKAFLKYLNKTNGIVIVLVIVEILRFTLEERRRGKKNAKR